MITKAYCHETFEKALPYVFKSRIERGGVGGGVERWNSPRWMQKFSKNSKRRGGGGIVGGVQFLKDFFRKQTGIFSDKKNLI